MELLGVIMNMTELLLGAIYFLAAVIGWFLKEALDNIKNTDKELNDFRVHVANEYTQKNDMRDVIKQINERFDRLETKIDRLMEGK